MTTNSAVAEIEIVGSLWPHHLEPGTAIGNGNARVDRVVVAGDVLAAIDRAEAGGARAILLVMETEGGASDAGFEVYNRLRAFSDAGGRVVAFVQGRCGSIGPIIAQAADVVLMRGDGKFLIHSAHGQTGSVREAINGAMANVLANRTGMELAKLKAYCSEVEVACTIHDLGAVRLGWADWTPVTIEYARQLAAMLARGGTLPETKRSSWLASTAAAPAPLLEGAVAHFTGSNESANYLPPGGATVATGTVAGILASALTSWTPGAIPTSVTWYGIAEATSGTYQGRIVAVGGTTNAAYSDSQGRTWTTATLPSATQWKAVCFGGPAGFVAVGTNGAGGTAKIATSPDGVTWTNQSFALTDGDLLAVKWNGARYVAVGTSGNALWSTNATAWTVAVLPTLNSSRNYGGLDWSPSLSTWVATGSRGQAATSPDGNTWTGRTVDFTSSPVLYAVAWSPRVGLFCAVGIGDAIYRSSDGISWTKGATGSGVQYSVAIVWAGNIFLATGYSIGVVRTAVSYSFDGINWQSYDISTGLTAVAIAWVQGYSAATPANRFVMVGANYLTADAPCIVSGSLP